MKTKSFLKSTCLLIAFLLLGRTQVFAQTLNKPTPADNPNFSGNSPWTAACASATFNQYYANFTWNTPLVDSNNEFILELSDANGSFSSPVELARVADKNTSFDFEFEFTLPNTTRGDGYRMRVRSTSPAIISPESDAYQMYYVDYNSPLLISENGSGTIPSGGRIEICSGNTTNLSVHNVPNANTYQYNWYRSSTPLAEKSYSIEVTQPGIYNVEIDYGAICSGSANTLSNDLTISFINNLGIAINAPAKTALCNGDTQDLVANIANQGLTYVWYKDGTAITTPTVDNHIYTIDTNTPGFEGDYQVEISGTGICLERSTTTTITNAANYTVTRDNPADIVLLPNQTKTLSASTTANNPVYQWYKDGTIISGATNNTLAITETGAYFSRVSQSGGACPTNAIDSETTNVIAPDSFELIIDYSTNYTACENTNVSLNLNTINAIVTGGDKVDVTTDLLTSFSYQWRKDGVNINGETNASINITSSTNNGTYTLDAILSTYNQTANILPVQLLTNETLSIASTNTVRCNATDAITISTTTDLTGASYEWFKDGTSYNTTNAELNVTDTGVYQLVLQRNGCPLKSNEITIAPLNPDLITLDSETNVVFPEGTTKTVNASGGTAYQWFDVNNVLLSNTAALDITQEGDYILVANIDACEITKTITAEYQDIFNVPNIITPNADGINDLWVIPNTYSQDAEVNVIIYNTNGKEVYNVFNYQNNWPQSTTIFTKQNMVFYYKIRNATEVLKQGTITVIR